MGVFEKFIPTRAARSPKLIADLDDLISQPIGFRYLGKEYTLEPMTTRNFMSVTRALDDLKMILSSQEGVLNEEAIYDAYYVFVSSLCRKISLSDIKKATVSQLHALLNLLIQHITGQTASQMVVDPEEKKKIQVSFLSSIFSRSLHSLLDSTRLVSKKS